MHGKAAILVAAAIAASTGLSQAADAAKPRVKLETTKGTIVVELEPQAAPKTVENFLQYVKDGFYDGTIFHRVIKQFMIQGGGFTKDMVQKPTRPPVVNEANNGLKNDLGTIAMARTPNPNSATAQFFINTKANDFLNFREKTEQGWGYCVFGKVVQGIETVRAIESVATSSGGMQQNVPIEPVVITKASLVTTVAQKPAPAKAATGDAKTGTAK